MFDSFGLNAFFFSKFPTVGFFGFFSFICFPFFFSFLKLPEIFFLLCANFLFDFFSQIYSCKKVLIIQFSIFF